MTLDQFNTRFDSKSDMEQEDNESYNIDDDLPFSQVTE